MLNKTLIRIKINDIYPGSSTHAKVIREVLHLIELEFGNAVFSLFFVFLFQERGKLENSEKNFSVQSKEPNKLHSGLPQILC